MYIETIPNRNSPPAVLLREAHREGGKVVKTTLANLSCLPDETIQAMRLALRGVKLVPHSEVFAVQRSLPHGHVQAVHGMMRKLDMDTLLSSRPCRERDLVLAMLAQRLLDPCSKLATTRQWHSTSLAEEMNVADADENELYAALDWLLARQHRLEKKLAQRHLREGGRALYDVSSSSYHGRTCPLARRGYNRDGQKLPCIVYGLLTDGEGRPIAVETYAGNTGDPSTVADQVEKLRKRFDISRVVLAGDRGMLTQTQIHRLQKHPQLGWISALRGGAIRNLVEQGAVQLSLFDQRNLAEIRSEAYPGERLIVCYNPLLAEDRRRTRNELLEATEKQLRKIVGMVERRTRTSLSAQEIGVRVGKVVNRFKVGKHFDLEIRDGYLGFMRNDERVKAEAQLDGIYVIRTSESEDELSAADAVRAYKSLAEVEQAFRCLKSLDIRVRPIHHRLEDRVKAHVLLCMLAYYVEWHLRKALASVLYADEELDTVRWQRDPVAKARPGETVQRKKRTGKNRDGWPVHSYPSLMREMATRCKNVCRVGEGKTQGCFTTLSEPTPFQRHVFDLLGLSA